MCNAKRVSNFLHLNISNFTKTLMHCKHMHETRVNEYGISQLENLVGAIYVETLLSHFKNETFYIIHRINLVK